MEYVADPVEHLSFADGSFDVVSSLNSLDHVDDLATAMSEIARVLVPGGSFLLVARRRRLSRRRKRRPREG